MEIISERRLEKGVNHVQSFLRADMDGGWSFDCDADGYVNVTLLNEAAKENLRQCMTGENGSTYEGMQSWPWHYWEPAVARCRCGAEVELRGFTNTCECGRDYNSAGQLLAPRECWGEETGEHPVDIARIR
jgi:hypothetical protein